MLFAGLPEHNWRDHFYSSIADLAQSSQSLGALARLCRRSLVGQQVQQGVEFAHFAVAIPVIASDDAAKIRKASKTSVNSSSIALFGSCFYSTAASQAMS